MSYVRSSDLDNTVYKFSGVHDGPAANVTRHSYPLSDADRDMSRVFACVSLHVCEVWCRVTYAWYDNGGQHEACSRNVTLAFMLSLVRSVVMKGAGGSQKPGAIPTVRTRRRASENQR